jgi:hypothetical protein
MRWIAKGKKRREKHRSGMKKILDHRNNHICIISSVATAAEAILHESKVSNICAISE